MSVVLDEHREYLSDERRVSAFRRAIAQTVRPGDVVVDLASGTGVLGLLACQAGASRVYAIEQSGLAGIAREIAHANGFGDRIIVVREHSTRAHLPEPADCLMCDQIGHFGFEAGAFEFLEDAVRWLKPDGRLIPRAIELRICPVEHADVRGRLAFWHSRPAALDFSAASAIARNTGYPVALEPSQLLAEPQRLVHVDLPHPAAQWLRGDVAFTITRDGTLDGVGGWFMASLADDVSLTNQPGHAERIHRRNVVLPASQPLAVTAGDLVRVAIQIRPIDMLVSWTVMLRRGDRQAVVAARATTFAGFLLSSEDLARTTPGWRPRLTRAGEARRALLSMIDGQHTVDDIEGELQASFPDLLPTPERTAGFVAEVLAGYAR